MTEPVILKRERKNKGVTSRGNILVDAESGRVLMDEFMDPSHLRNGREGYRDQISQRVDIITERLVEEINEKYPTLKVYPGRKSSLRGYDSLSGECKEYAIPIKTGANKRFGLFPKTIATVSAEDSPMCLHKIECGDSPLIILMKEVAKEGVDGWRFTVFDSRTTTEKKRSNDAIDGYLHEFYRDYPEKESDGSRPLVREDFEPMFLLGKDCAHNTPYEEASYNVILHGPNAEDTIIVAGAHRSISDLASSFAKLRDTEFKEVTCKGKPFKLSIYGEEGQIREVDSIERSHEYYPPHSIRMTGNNDKYYPEFNPVSPDECSHVYFPWLKPVSNSDIQEFRKHVLESD